MVGTSTWDYVFIRSSIILLYLVAPLSIVYSLVNSLVRLPFNLPRVLEVWLALETAFYLLIYLPRKAYLQRAATHPTATSSEERRNLFWRCHGNIPDPERFLSKWFLDAPAKEIKRENVKEFYRWAYLNTAERDPAYDEEVEYCVGEMENLLGRKFEPGRGNAKCLRLTLDKVEMLHRSLTWYFCVFVVDTIASVYLLAYSFDFHRTSLLRSLATFPSRLLTLFTNYHSPAKSLTYWYRPHTSKTRLPILFIHGIGIGLYPYINFLAEINAEDGKDAADGQVGIIAVEILPISSRITAQAMLKEEMCEEIQCILKAHGWDRFVLVYRKPNHANEYLLSYFGSKDMGVSHTLFRRFFWTDNLLWKEDIQNHRVTVVLAGKDAIVDTKVIGAYLTGAKDWVLDSGGLKEGMWKGDRLDVLWFENLDHGQVFDRKRTRRQLLGSIIALSICVLSGCRSNMEKNYSIINWPRSTLTLIWGQECDNATADLIPDVYKLGTSGVCRVTDGKTSCKRKFPPSLNLARAVLDDLEEAGSAESSNGSAIIQECRKIIDKPIEHSTAEKLGIAMVSFIIVSIFLNLLSALVAAATGDPFGYITTGLVAIDALFIFTSLIMCIAMMNYEGGGYLKEVNGSEFSDREMIGIAIWMLVGMLIARIISNPFLLLGAVLIILPIVLVFVLFLMNHWIRTFGLSNALLSMLKRAKNWLGPFCQPILIRHNDMYPDAPSYAQKESSLPRLHASPIQLEEPSQGSRLSEASDWNGFRVVNDKARHMPGTRSFRDASSAID
ncbi:hypothetical protein FZEAL_91 [Fusarium zealandicum]|uniref:Uncharacterized protein n=1 Tax=Fusarium zealandicum TaxID=1053134 RepID=A0A8H4UVW3_9HYPO|nr:hypothetical protein FZEAL_91 [Fusarium zealandicum]